MVRGQNGNWWLTELIQTLMVGTNVHCGHKVKQWLGLVIYWTDISGHRSEWELVAGDELTKYYSRTLQCGEGEEGGW